MSRIGVGCCIAILAGLAGTLAGCSISRQSGCDRDCLVGISDTYLAAIVAHDPGQAPLARDVAFVENITRLQPGQGVWATATGVSDQFRIVVPDPVRSTVGMLVLIERETRGEETPALLAVRLAVKGGRIVEAEHLVDEVPAAADMANLQRPRPPLVAEVPEAERMSRRALARIAGSYYDALNRSDGSLAPFAADCEREENGMITAGYRLGPAVFDSIDVNGRPPPPVARDCIGQMDSRRFAYIDSIDNRRIFAVDPVQGLAMGLSHFRQSMAFGPHRMIAADGTEVMWDEKREPYDLPAAHIFKIAAGEIHEVEALGIFVPYNSPTGWE